MNNKEKNKQKDYELEAQIAKWKLRNLVEEWEFNKEFSTSLNELRLYPLNRVNSKKEVNNLLLE